MTHDHRPTTEEVHNHDLSTINQQDRMKKLSRLGFDLTSAEHLTESDIAKTNRDEVPIVIAMKRDESDDSYTPVMETVPADWYNDVRHAEKIFDTAGFEGHPAVSGVTVKAGTHTGSEPTRIQVEVAPKLAAKHNTTLKRTQRKIPKNVEGVPIDVVESSVAELGCYKFDGGNSPPAGIVCKGSSEYGSLGSLLRKNGNTYFSTARHLFDNHPHRDILHQKGDRIGRVVDHDCHLDFVAAKPINGHSVTQDIVNSNLRTNGHYTKSGVHNLASKHKYISKKGKRTCFSAGKVHGIGIDTVYDARCKRRHHQVKWGNGGADFNKGDSGSIAWRENINNNVFVVCLNTAFAPNNLGDHVIGSAAFQIHRKHGFGW